MKRGLTDLAIRKAALPSDGTIEIWDRILPGFGVRITKSGSKSFVLVYRIDGKRRRLTLGQYPILSLAQAREMASDAIRAIKAGIDPSLSRSERRRRSLEAQNYRFNSIVEQFIEQHCRRRNRTITANDTARILRTKFVQQWGERDLRGIGRKDIIAVLDDLCDQGKPSAANHSLSAVRKLFSWCVERDILQSSPCAGIRKPAKDRARDRVLNDSELVAVWNAALRIGYPFGIFVALLILTGQRRSEVAAMKWRHLSLDEALWTLPSEITKNGKTHVLPLSIQVLSILKSLPRFSGEYVLPSSVGGPFCGFSAGKRQLDAECQLPHWTLHDLRRTVATNLAMNGVLPHVIERILNHSSGTFGGVAGVYNRFQYVDQMRTVLQDWANRLGVENPSYRLADRNAQS